MRLLFKHIMARVGALVKNNWLHLIRLIVFTSVIICVSLGYLILTETYRIIYEPFHGNEISVWDQVMDIEKNAHVTIESSRNVTILCSPSRTGFHFHYKLCELMNVGILYG